MARGKSGRVVLEIDPELKRQLYASLENRQETMKEWFIKEAESLIYGDKKPSLADASDKQSRKTNKGGGGK
ncbi:MAG: hypothetical protein COB33_000935 [Thiotrichaceae bacterium]|nr:hypothetical protein [Thiotrichaceae bacterium]